MDFFNCPKPKNRKERAFQNRLNQLLLIACRVFKWDNLPPNLPQWEIEKRLIMSGRCCVFKNNAYGVITSVTSTYGVDIYNNANMFNYAQAVIGSESGLEDNVDGVIGYGCSIDKISGGTIGKRLRYYADLLSDIDVSRQILVINSRATSAVIAKSDNALNQLTNYYSALQNGSITVPRIDSGVLESVEPLHKATVQGATTLAELDSAENNIVKRFYSDFGIAYSDGKRERLISDEIQSNNDSLDINIIDMLECRRDMAQAINSLYATNIIVGVDNRDIT